MILNILYHGLSCFEIEAKGTSGGGILVADPYDTKGTGLRLPRTLSADIVTISGDNPLHNNTEAVASAKLIITEPGEYEKSGIFVYGIPVKSGENGAKQSVIFRYEFEDLVAAHLGDLAHGLTDEELSHLENVDILFLPVGGAPSSREATKGEGESLDFKKAAEIANQIEPRIIIPMHFAMPSLSAKLDPADKFLKEYGAKAETMPKLKIAKKDLPQEETKVIILEKA